MLIPSRAYKADKDWNLSFDGTDDFVDSGISTQTHALSQFTMFCWVRPSTLSKNFVGFLGNRPSSGLFGNVMCVGDTVIGRDAVVLGAYGGDANLAYSAKGVLAVNTWRHLTYVFDGGLTGNASRLKLYVGGTQYTLTFAGTIPATTDSPAQNMLIGNFMDNTSYRLPGRMANVAFFNRALPQKEIQYYMNRYLTGREPGLIAYYPFLDKTGTTLKDWSNNKRNATITGATWQRGV